MVVRSAEALAHAMIGEPGSRFRVPTPALIVDEAVLDENIARMAACTRGRVTLRPHAKTHKSAWIAGKQIAAGAVGVCCAKLGEVEALSVAGVRGILLTSPVVDSTVPRRLCDVAAVDPEFMCAVDHPDPVTALGLEATSRGVTVKVIIDVDVGLMRTGVSGDGAALALADHIRRHPSLTLAGVQGYGGHWQHIAGFEARRDAVRMGRRCWPVLSTRSASKATASRSSHAVAPAPCRPISNWASSPNSNRARYVFMDSSIWTY